MKRMTILVCLFALVSTGASAAIKELKCQSGKASVELKKNDNGKFDLFTIEEISSDKEPQVIVSRLLAYNLVCAGMKNDPMVVTCVGDANDPDGGQFAIFKSILISQVSLSINLKKVISKKMYDARLMYSNPVEVTWRSVYNNLFFPGECSVK